MARSDPRPESSDDREMDANDHEAVLVDGFLKRLENEIGVEYRVKSDLPIRLRFSLYTSDIGIYDNGYDDILQRFKGRKSSRIVLVFNLKASGGRFTLPMSNNLKRAGFGSGKTFQLILNHINVVVTRRG